MLQYQETDWTFLQRLASHAGAALIPNTLSHRPQIWIGVPQTGKQIQLEGVPFTLKRNLAPYLDQVTNRFKDGKPSDGNPPGAHDLAPHQPGDFPEIEGNQLGDISKKIRRFLDNMEGKDE